MAKPSSRPRAGVVYTLAAIAPRLFLHAILRRRYSGTENLPKSGGFIAASPLSGAGISEGQFDEGAGGGFLCA